MASLKDLFRDLQTNKMSYLVASKGSDFEERIHEGLNRQGYSRIVKSDLDPLQPHSFSVLKAAVTNKTSADVPTNPYESSHRKHFLVQPYGSQNYPDVLVLHDNLVVMIEIKFKKTNSGLPVWNSGLPRPNGIYIYGSLGRSNITFFRGEDIVSAEDAKLLHALFDIELKAREREFNQQVLAGHPYGFSVYVRKAFDQGKQYNDAAIVDFFTNPDREWLEANVIAHVP